MTTLPRLAPSHHPSVGKELHAGDEARRIARENAFGQMKLGAIGVEEVDGMGADQPHNGRLIAAAGAGLALTKPEASALRAAIQTVVGDAELRTQAVKLASEIAAMPTIESAVDVLLGIPSAP